MTMDRIDFLKSKEFLRIKKLMGISDEDKKFLRWKFPPITPTLKLLTKGFFITTKEKFCIFATKFNMAKEKANINFTLPVV